MKKVIKIMSIISIFLLSVNFIVGCSKKGEGSSMEQSATICKEITLVDKGIAKGFKSSDGKNTFTKEGCDTLNLVLANHTGKEVISARVNYSILDENGKVTYSGNKVFTSINPYFMAKNEKKYLSVEIPEKLTWKNIECNVTEVSFK